MTNLLIKKADGSLYWSENFYSLNEAEGWLAEERSRPYWKPEYTWEFVDKTPPPPSAAELAEKAKKIQDRQDAVNGIKSAITKSKQIKDLDEMKVEFESLVKNVSTVLGL
jgi:hypothetical protein